MFYYLLLLAIAEIVLSFLVAWKSLRPAQLAISAVAIPMLLVAFVMLVQMRFSNAWPTILPFILIGVASPLVVGQLFTVEPRRE